VTKVLRNAMYYAPLLGRGGPSLKQRLATIPPRGSSAGEEVALKDKMP